MELETDIVTHASGSTRLRLANTNVLVGVKAEIDLPNLESPKAGKIEFFIDWSVAIIRKSSRSSESNVLFDSSYECLLRAYSTYFIAIHEENFTSWKEIMGNEWEPTTPLLVNESEISLDTKTFSLLLVGR